jgi:N-acetylglucosaminyl-diphospho-decaprenol L-rhamnosyltransferase
MGKQSVKSSMMITVSVVSHGQWPLVAKLLDDFQASCASFAFELILTLNIPELADFDAAVYNFPIRIIRNPQPRGFGANHNAAFSRAVGRYFCVMNPDIRFDSCPFGGLLASFSDPSVGIAAPLVLGPNGQLEDSARRFPTPGKILAKLTSGAQPADYASDGPVRAVDWCAGMLLLFPSQVYAELQGFDERYFLYYEDVDICARLSLSQRQIMWCTDTQVVHHAQRTSHRHIKYTWWHVRSIVRFFLSPVYRRLRGVGRL